MNPIERPCPLEDTVPYPVDTCRCPACQFVLNEFGELSKRLVDSGASPWSIVTVWARTLGMFVGFHAQEGRDLHELVERLSRMIEGRARIEQVRCAEIDAKEATKQ